MESAHNSTEVATLLYSECRALQFKARKWAEEQTSGDYRSISKGSGMEFDEARLYVPGDDSRRIDWKLTARKSSTYVKSFIEERDSAVSLLIDLSASTLLGSRITLLERVLEISAFLSSIALFNKDIISAILFDEKIRERIKPSKKATSIFHILHSIIDVTKDADLLIPRPNSGIEIVLEEACHFLKRKNLIFIISDFKFQPTFKSILSYLSQKHEVFAIWLQDDLKNLSSIARIAKVYNPETGEQVLCDFSSKATIKKIVEDRAKHEATIIDLFHSSGTRFIKVNEEDETKDVLSSFLMRESRAKRSR